MVYVKSGRVVTVMKLRDLLAIANIHVTQIMWLQHRYWQWIQNHVPAVEQVSIKSKVAIKCGVQNVIPLLAGEQGI